LAQTSLRTADDQLYVGIYYSRWLTNQLERRDPRAGLSDRNISSLIMFVDEINPALRAALQFKIGRRPRPYRLEACATFSRFISVCEIQSARLMIQTCSV